VIGRDEEIRRAGPASPHQEQPCKEAERAADFERAARLRYGEAVQLERQLEEANRR
jgi:hypothetical protein